MADTDIRMWFGWGRADTEDDWWEGTAKGKKGVFPSNYVELI